jgi:uncharacterized FAD-dependent dehydrogenase
VTIVEQIRATVEALGGEYRFQSKVEDIEIDVEADGNRQVRGVVLADGSHIAADHVVLAIGHSARDTFQMLFDRGVAIEAKAFSIGARIEHPQSLIDRCRFGERATAARSTASACARAAPWWRRRPSPAASSPTA